MKGQITKKICDRCAEKGIGLLVVNVSGMVTKLAGTPRASARGGMQGASFVMKAWAARNAMQLVRDSAACFGRRHLVNFALDAIDKAKFPKRRATCGPPMPEIWNFDPSRYNGEGRNDHNTPPAFSGGMLTCGPNGRFPATR